MVVVYHQLHVNVTTQRHRRVVIPACYPMEVVTEARKKQEVKNATQKLVQTLLDYVEKITSNVALSNVSPTNGDVIRRAIVLMVLMKRIADVRMICGDVLLV